jgi:hypothetical protein
MDRLTFGDIAKLGGWPRHILDHALRAHGPEPVARLGGIWRLWDRSQLPEILESVNRSQSHSASATNRAKAALA